MRATPPARQALVAALRREVEKLEGVRPPEDDRRLSTGVAALDRLLPGGGLRRGSLVEYLTPGSGSGTATLALSAVREACREGGALVVVEQPEEVAGTLRVPLGPDEKQSRLSLRESTSFRGAKGDNMRQQAGVASMHPQPPSDGTRSVPTTSWNGTRSVPTTFYPPAAAAWGIDLSRMLIVRPASQADAVWVLEQALRCAGVAAVWAPWLGSPLAARAGGSPLATRAGGLDVRDFRRLQLAAESGRTLGILLRPAQLRGQPTWAEVQWEVRNSRRVGPANGASADPRGEDVGFARKRVPKKTTSAPHGSAVAKAPSTHPTPWRLEVELVRCRGAAGGQVVQIELDETAGIWREVTHAADPVPLPAELADPATARRA